MLVITNKFIPSANKKFKKQKPIANTEGGDNAYYITKSLSPIKKKKARYLDTDSDDSDESDESDNEIDF